MRFTERRFTRLGETDPLEREFRDVQQVVERARQNQWFGGDVLEPEFAPVLAAIVAPRPLRYATLVGDPRAEDNGVDPLRSPSADQWQGRHDPA
jgi:hypothetical protein